jgi:peptide/nickel transport system permease protein
LAPIGTPGYLLGADDLGRDILSRLIWGGRISLLIGFSAVMVSMVLGVLIGLVAGYFGGHLDALTMRLIDILLAFPAILLAITIVASLGPGLRNSMLAVSIVGIPYYARIIRGNILSLREQEFVHAARLIGATHTRIIIQHVLPNTLAPLMVAATLDVGFMIIAAAGLSFLGLGAQPPTAEWGVMLQDGFKFVRDKEQWIIVPPGLAIAVTGCHARGAVGLGWGGAGVCPCALKRIVGKQRIAKAKYDSTCRMITSVDASCSP